MKKRTPDLGDFLDDGTDGLGYPPGASTPPQNPGSDRLDRAAVEAAIRRLKDRDCPYLGGYKLGYDSALDDLQRELWGDV